MGGRAHRRPTLPPDSVSSGLGFLRRHPLTVLLLTAAVLRVVALLAFGDLDSARGDERYYVAQARSLVTDGTYSGALRPPGQSLLIAGAFGIFGESLLAARLVEIVLSLGVVALVVAIARPKLGERAALAGGWLCAINPTLVHYAHLLWSETLYATLVLLALWGLERFSDARARRWLVLAGASVGLAALTRESGLYLIPLLTVGLFVGPGRAPSRLRDAIVFGAVGLTMVLPWIARNSLAYGELVSVSTNRWRMIAQGNVPADVIRDLRLRAGDRYAYRGARDALERERIARVIAIDAIAQRQPWWLLEKVRSSTRDLLASKSQLARFVKKRWLPPKAAPAARLAVGVERGLLALTVLAGVAGLWLAGGAASTFACGSDPHTLGDLRAHVRAQPVSRSAPPASRDRRGASADDESAVARPGSLADCRSGALGLHPRDGARRLSPRNRSKAAIYFPTMPNPSDRHDAGGIIDRVDDAEIADANS